MSPASPNPPSQSSEPGQGSLVLVIIFSYTPLSRRRRLRGKYARSDIFLSSYWKHTTTHHSETGSPVSVTCRPFQMLEMLMQGQHHSDRSGEGSSCHLHPHSILGDHCAAFCKGEHSLSLYATGAKTIAQAPAQRHALTCMAPAGGCLVQCSWGSLCCSEMEILLCTYCTQPLFLQQG